MCGCFVARLRNVEFPRAEHLLWVCICLFWAFICVLFVSCAWIAYSFLCRSVSLILFALPIFLFLIISRMHGRLSNLCVTVSLWLLAQGIFLFPISCMCLEFCAHNILPSCYPCAGCMCFMCSCRLRYPTRNPQRGSVAQTADGNKQGAEPPGHPYHLVGLKHSHCGRWHAYTHTHTHTHTMQWTSL